MDSNVSLRQRVKALHIPLWRVASEIGVSEGTLVRWMRFELTGERKTRVCDAVERLEQSERLRGDLDA